jgi:hypothetical protein
VLYDNNAQDDITCSEVMSWRLPTPDTEISSVMLLILQNVIRFWELLEATLYSLLWELHISYNYSYIYSLTWCCNKK